jgi:hypothetical protein
MEYKNFHRDILVKRRVQLVGWPFPKLQSPGSMGSSLPVFTKILKAIENEEIRFESLSLKEVQRLDNEHEAKIAAGELEGPAERKIRSDAGKRKAKKRKQRDDTSEESDDGDEDDGWMTKNGRKSSDQSHASATAKSKEILTDTDESE